MRLYITPSITATDMVHGGALSVISVVSWLISAAISVLAIIALIKAYGYIEYRIPLIGNLAEKIGGKLQNANISM